MVYEGASQGWLFGMSFMGSLTLVLACLLIPIVLYKCYLAGPRRPVTQSSRPKAYVENVYYPYGVEELQGKRNYMEDRHVEAGMVGRDPTASFYAIFDGHGGSRASEFCIRRMLHILEACPFLLTDPHKALVHAFMQTDREFLDVARRFRYDDGTTACAALVLNKRIIVANAGDSRAIIVQRQGKVVAMSSDHKPNRTDEKERIRQLGGSVFLVGVWRVEGILAVSRAIGDRVLKRYVTPVPDIKERTVGPQDRFLVIASDGLWDVMSNEEVADFVYKLSDPQKAASILVEYAYMCGSTDNITVTVVDLTNPASVAQAGNSGGKAVQSGIATAASKLLTPTSSSKDVNGKDA